MARADDAFPPSSLLAALENDFSELCAHLRAGVASGVEQALAADLIEGKAKPRRPRPGSDWKNRLLVALIVSMLEEALANPASLEKFAAKFPDAPDPLQAMKKTMPRKNMLYLARKIAAAVGKSKMMSEREAYYALKEYAGRRFKIEIKDDD
jgi:hypothetical protein